MEVMQKDSIDPRQKNAVNQVINPPELQALKSKYNDALYIAINNGEKKKIIKKFLKRHQFEYLILMDPEKNVAKLYGIESLPHTLVISKNKKITYLGIRPPKSLPLP